MVETPQEPYVKFPKRLYDALLKAPMSGVQKDIAFAVVRRTIGHYNQATTEIGLQLLVEMTGHHRTRLSRARQDLLREGVLVETRPATCARAAMIKINRDPSKWGAYAVEKLSASCGQAADCGQQVADGESADCGEGVSDKGTGLSADSGPLKNPEESLERSSKDRRPIGDDAPRDEDARDEDDDPPRDTEKGRSSGRVHAGTIMAECMAFAKAAELPIDDAYRGHLAAQIQGVLRAGHDPGIIREAACRLITKNRTPGDLRWVVGDLARGRENANAGPSTGTAGRSGRSLDGEF